MSRYAKKQFTIAVIFILIVILVVLGIYYLIKPSATCFDGKQNQGETNIDCGGSKCGPCPEDIREELVALSQGFIPTIPSDFDLVAKIKNPNNDWGVEFLDYQFNLYDKNDKLIGLKQGKTYFLPQETKYIIKQRVSPIPAPSMPIPKLARIEIEIKDINWQELKDFEELEISIKDKKHEITEQGFNKVSGNVENKSSYDLAKIEINGLLFNEDNKLIAVGRTGITNALAGEVRYFEINWPYEVSEEVSSYELKAHTNVFSDENFIRRY